MTSALLLTCTILRGSDDAAAGGYAPAAVMPPRACKSHGAKGQDVEPLVVAGAVCGYASDGSKAEPLCAETV